MLAHEEEKGPKQRKTRRLGPRCIFCFIFLRFIDNNSPKRPQTRCLGCFVGLSPHQLAAPHSPHHSWARTRPTKAHEGRQESTKRKKGPNNASCVVWALGVSFFEKKSLF